MKVPAVLITYVMCRYCCSNNQSVCNDNRTGGKCTHAVTGHQLVCSACPARRAEPTCADQPAGAVVSAVVSFNTTPCSTDAGSRRVAASCRHGRSLTAAESAPTCCSAKPLCTSRCCTISTESKSISMKHCTSYRTIERYVSADSNVVLCIG